MKPLRLFVAISMLLMACQNPKKEKIMDRMEVIAKEEASIADSLKSSADYNQPEPRNYKARLKALQNEFDSLKKVVKNM